MVMAYNITTIENGPQAQPSCLLLNLMSKRRTWDCLFITVYTVLLFCSWNLLKSILSWYESSVGSSSSPSGEWPAIYASILLGAVFGLTSMAATLAIVVPVTIVTWTSVLVLLTLCGKTRKSLVVEVRKLTAEIVWTVAMILVKEGNAVTVVCAILGYFVLFRKIKEEGFW